MVKVSSQARNTAARPRPTAMSFWGYILDRNLFHRYREGYRFAQARMRLVGKHGFLAYQAKGLPRRWGLICLWTQAD